jgi:hypothetical protein
MLVRRAYVTPSASDRGELSTTGDLRDLRDALRGIDRLSNDRMRIA